MNNWSFTQGLRARDALLLVVFGTFIARVPVAAAEPLRITNSDLRLGDSTVRIVTTETSSSGLTFLSLHENEQTSVTAARQIVGRHGGRLIEVRQQQQRLLSFSVSQGRYRVDPNRIFTDTGIERSLRLYGLYSPRAQEAVIRFREELLAKLLKGQPRIIIAVHNNEGLSTDSYRTGGRFEKEAANVAVNPKLYKSDFFLVWDDSLFNRLQAAGFNVVLQSRTPSDDGSLSVYCQKNQVPYANVECGHGHLEEQTRMTDALVSIVERGQLKRG